MEHAWSFSSETCFTKLLTNLDFLKLLQLFPSQKFSPLFHLCESIPKSVFRFATQRRRDLDRYTKKSQTILLTVIVAETLHPFRPKHVESVIRIDPMFRREGSATKFRVEGNDLSRYGRGYQFLRVGNELKRSVHHLNVGV